MLKNGLLLVFLCCVSALYGQDITTPYKNRKILATQDTIKLDSVSINKAFFKLQDAGGADIDTSFYNVDFRKSTLVFRNGFTSQDTLTVRYLSYPEYLTKKYSIYDQSRV